jgi:hypothetical protein
MGNMCSMPIQLFLEQSVARAPLRAPSVPEVPQDSVLKNLTEVVEDLEDGKQAGSDKQSHLSPNVSQQLRHFISCLLFHGLIVEGFKEDIQNQYILRDVSLATVVFPGQVAS